MARRTAAEAAATRKVLLDTAHCLFAERGYEATPAEDIAAAAGVTRGALYHHFIDKRTLFREVLLIEEHRVRDGVEIAANRHADPRTAFLAGCRRMFDLVTAPGYQRIVAQDGPAVLGMAEWHSIDMAVGLASLERGLDGLVRGGLLPSAKRTTAILLLGALTEAALATTRGGKDVPPPAELLEEFERLLDALCATSAARSAR